MARRGERTSEATKEKIRQAKLAHPSNAKLSAQEEAAIQAARAAGVSCGALAQRYGVARSTISRRARKAKQS